MFTIYVYDVAITLGSVIGFYVSNSIHIYLIVLGVRAINGYFAPSFLMLYVGRLLYKMIEREVMDKERAAEKKKLIMRRIIPMVIPGAFFTLPFALLLITKTHVSYVQPLAIAFINGVTFIGAIQALVSAIRDKKAKDATASKGLSSSNSAKDLDAPTKPISLKFKSQEKIVATEESEGKADE